ncbi:39S ribosomal protein L2, mitochondrial [Turdus rufiventris]|nr:39S ribosomal protein L2, mitochondrial [Turdus rufiventris]
MAALGLCRAFGALLLSAGPRRARPPALPQPCLPGPVAAACRGLSGSAPRCTTDPLWKCRTKYTVRPVGMKKTGGRDHTGRIRVRGIGGGHKQRYRMIDFQRLRYEEGAPPEPFTEKVISVRYDPCRRVRVSASEGDAYPLGALPIGTLICNLESHPGKGAQYIRAAGTCGVLLRKVNGTAIVQLPSKRQIQVLETCVATVGRVSNVDHNKRVIGKAGRNRWLGKRPHTGLWHRKGGWAGRKIKPLPPMKSYVNLPRVKAVE